MEPTGSHYILMLHNPQLRRQLTGDGARSQNVTWRPSRDVPFGAYADEEGRGEGQRAGRSHLSVLAVVMRTTRLLTHLCVGARISRRVADRQEVLAHVAN